MIHDSKTQAKARALYQAGKSFDQIGKAVKVSKPTLVKWSKEQGWEKGKALPALVQKEEETLLAQAEKIGLTKAKVLGKINEFLGAKKTEIVGANKRDAGLGDETAGGFVQEVDDYRTQVEGAKMAVNVLGMNAPTKVQDDRFAGVLEWIRRQ